MLDDEAGGRPITLIHPSNVRRLEATATVWVAAYSVDADQMASLERTWQSALERVLHGV